MRRAAWRRITRALDDLQHARACLQRAEQQMIALPGEPGTDCERICEIPGLSPVLLAAILAGTGDLRAYESLTSPVERCRDPKPA